MHQSGAALHWCGVPIKPAPSPLAVASRLPCASNYLCPFLLLLLFLACLDDFFLLGASQL
eukprot:m.284269 g.284269  ORF g.284269 m.284269 type:complete len:60 (-) comp15761_c2_seq14:1772-1951(-)